MKETYKILHLEDVPTDAELVARELKRFNLDFEHHVIDTEAEYVKALDHFQPDIILCDHSLPTFNSREALRIVKAKKLFIPFVLITATMSEEVAMGVIKEGADDYILKDRLKRLPNAVINNIEKYRFEKERKRFVDEMHQKEALSKELLEHLSNKLLLATKVTGIGTWEYDIHTNKFIADDNLYGIYGGPLLSLAGLIQHVHLDDKERVSRELQEALLLHTELDSNFKIVRRGGEVRYIKGMTIIQRDSLNNATSIIGTNQDVTNDKLAEQAIRESENKYRSFFENSLDGILLTDPGGKIFEANSAACAVFGMTEAEIIKAGRLGLVDATDQNLQLLLQERRTTGKAKGEIIFRRKDGSTFSGEVSSAIFTDAAGQERTCMIIRDVTERKQAEQKILATSTALTSALGDLQKIMGSSIDIICTIDRGGRFANVSAACTAIWGYTPEELKGMEYMQLVCEEDIKRTQEAAQAIMSGTPLTMFENRYIHKDGSEIPVLWSARWDENEQLMFCIAKDGSEKKRLEKAFNDERQRFYDLFLNAPASVGIFEGPEHVFKMVNPQYLQLTGRANIIGRPVREVFPEIENQGLFDVLDSVYKTGNSFVAKERLVRVEKEGSGKLSDIYLNFVYQAYRNQQNEIEGIFFFAIDVTEQVMSRIKVEESEKRFKQLIYDLPEALYTCDAEGKIMLFNKAAEQLWGEKPMVGHNLFSGSWKMYHADGTPLPMDQTPIALTLQQASLRKEKELIIERHDGTRRHVRPNPIPTFDNNGKLTGAVNMLIDITDITLFQEKLRENQEHLLESQRIAHIGSWQVDITNAGSIETLPLQCSDETCRIFGISPKSSETFAFFSRFIYPRDRAMVSLKFKNAISTKTPISLDIRIVNTAGSTRWVHIEGKVITNAFADKQSKMFGAIKDITVRKEQELQLEKNAEEREILIGELTKSIHDLKQFTFITSHNFRAPLSNLVGLLGLLDLDALTEENREIIGMFKASTLQLNKTINDLIQILIIKNNASVLVTKIDFEKLLTETFQLLSYDLGEIECTTEFDLAVKEISFNKPYLESILLNLFTNAFKYRSSKRPLRITVKTFVSEEGEVTITVEDNGLGIDLKRHGSKIFGLYQRFHEEADGAGLGLFMIKSQITSLGGTIDVESVVDGGTTFTIRVKQK